MLGRFSERVFDIRLHLKSSEYVLQTSRGELPGFVFNDFVRCVEELSRWYPKKHFGTSTRTLKDYFNRLIIMGFIEEIPIDEANIILKMKYKKRERFYRFCGAWESKDEQDEKSEVKRIIIQPQEIDLSIFVGKNIIKEDRKNEVKWK